MPDLDPTQHLIDLALKEDLADAGDLTSSYFVPAEARGCATIFAKEEAVVSGAEVAAQVFRTIDADLEIFVDRPGGSPIEPRMPVLNISGSLRSILTAERTALNFLQRLSGIATLTRSFVSQTKGTPAKILDTRKTTPAWRFLEKRAVAHGGGANHRMGLYDHVMVKDNHLLANPDSERMKSAIAQVKSDHPECRVQFEADTLDQLKTFLTLEGVDSILLDNMGLDPLRDAVALRNETAPKITLEASGGVTLDTVAGIAKTGVDFISVGALTHSARAIDFSLELSVEK